MVARKLTNEDYCRAAKRFNCKVAAIKAVAKVESAGDGFLPDGRVKILFERHHFSRLTRRRFDADYPQISNRKAGGYYGNEKEYQRFNLAFSLDPVAAMMSCSWGKFQIMGFNHAICGYASVHDFVDDMKRSEGDQLDAFCSFVEHNNLDDELRRLDWAGFARGYNGKNYHINRYDEKMAESYKLFAKEKIDCDIELLEIPIQDSAAASESGDGPSAVTDTTSFDPSAGDPSVIPQTAVAEQQPTEATARTETHVGSKTETVEVVAKNEQDVNQTATVSTAQYQEVGFIGALKKDFAVIGGGNFSLQALQEYVNQASGLPPWAVSIVTKLAIVAAIGGGAWLIFRLVHYIIWKLSDTSRQKLEAHINSDVTRKNIAFN